MSELTEKNNSIRTQWLIDVRRVLWQQRLQTDRSTHRVQATGAPNTNTHTHRRRQYDRQSHTYVTSASYGMDTRNAQLIRYTRVNGESILTHDMPLFILCMFFFFWFVTFDVSNLDDVIVLHIRRAIDVIFSHFIIRLYTHFYQWR